MKGLKPKLQPKRLQPQELQPAAIRTPLWSKVQVVLLFALLGLNALALHKDPKYLIASNGQVSEALPGRERAELARGFVKKILPLLFWYTNHPPAALGVTGQDTYVFENLRIWIPNAEASYALAGSLQTAFLKGLASDHYAKIKRLGADSCILQPLAIPTPQPLGDGQWLVYFAGEKFFNDEKGQILSKEGYRVKVTLQEVDPPDKPLGGMSAADRLVYEARLAGFVITRIEQAPEEIK